MSCRAENKRYAAIYDVITNLVNSEPDVNTLEDVLEYFQNDPELSQAVSEQDIINTLTATSANERAMKVKSLKIKRNQIQQTKEALNDLQEMVKEMDNTNTSTPPKDTRGRLNRIKNAISRINELARMSDSVGPSSLVYIFNQTSLLSAGFSRFYEDNKDIEGRYSEQSTLRGKKDVKDALKSIRDSMYMNDNQSDIRLAAIDERIEQLESDDPDVAAFYAPEPQSYVDPGAASPELETLRTRVEIIQQLTKGTGGLGSALRRVVKDLSEPKEPSQKKQTSEEEAEVREAWKKVRGLVNFQKGVVSLAEVQKVKEIFDQLMKDYPKLVDDYDTVGDAFDQALENIKEEKQKAKRKRLLDAFEKERLKYKETRKDLLETPAMASALQQEKETVRSMELQGEILDLEYKLAEQKRDYEKWLRKERRRILIDRGAKLKIDLGDNIGELDIAKPFRHLYYKFNQPYEALRSLKFMADFSVLGNQLNFFVMQDLMGMPRFKQGMKAAKEGGSFSDILGATFPGQDRAMRVLRDAMVKTMEFYLFNSGKEGRTYADEMIRAMQESPGYLLAKKMGLQLSQPGVVGKSEEMWKTDALDDIPVVGRIKRYSEDSMVLGLNIMRLSLFEKFVANNPTASELELKRYATHLNVATGTASGKTGSLEGYTFGQFGATFFSAPKLFVSKAIMMLKMLPFFTGADLITSFLTSSLSESTMDSAFGNRLELMTKGLTARGLAEGTGMITQDKARKQQAREIGRYIQSFYTMLTMMSFMGGYYEDDPWSKDFMRLRVGKRVLDITGGLGGFYRTLNSLLHLGWHGEDISGRVTSDQGHFGATGIFGDLFFTKRPHPAISASMGMLTRSDFFGDPYTKLFGDALFGSVSAGSRTEAAIRATLPIAIEELMDNALDNTIWESPDEAATTFTLNFFGVNNYIPDTEDQSVEALTNLKILGKDAKTPPMTYPDDLKKTGGRYEDNQDLTIVRNEIQTAWKDVFGEYIKGFTKRELKPYEDDWEGFKDEIFTPDERAQLRKQALIQAEQSQRYENAFRRLKLREEDN